MYVDGPFGAGQQDWINYDVSVLVGGGIGVTPYASIIKDFVFVTCVKNTFRIKCRKVYTGDDCYVTLRRYLPERFAVVAFVCLLPIVKKRL